ncbi:MAG: hypothetical protein ABI759_18675 [Candidatus Solibacter sp.]
MRPFGLSCLICAFVFSPLQARQEIVSCATSSSTASEVMFLHRQAERRRAGRPRPLAAAASTSRDLGNIAVIEDSDGIVETLNQFTLDRHTLTFSPLAGGTPRYQYLLSDLVYDQAAADQGRVVAALGDDDFRGFTLPFAFPYYGASYTQAFLNSDGNLTFTAGESASSTRSLGRMTGGPPRIAALFDDLDPSASGGSVRYFADSGRVVFSWVKVREYSDFGAGRQQTFQLRLYVDGRIEFAYNGVVPQNAVVGIAPGSAKAGTAVVSFLTDPSGEYSAAVAERFGNTQDVDIVALAQKFYQTHDDAYDFLVVYNTMGVAAQAGALAYEATVRSRATGYGVPAQDAGAQYGSGSRLLSMLNLGKVGDYPSDPAGTVLVRAAAQDTPMTVLGHEAGHLFLAFASIPDPGDPTARPMIGFGGSHWSFAFNSEASLNEGEQIIDRGDGRFVTGAVTQGYSPLDRYLMGFAPPAAVPDTFVVLNPSVSPLRHPESNVPFTGTRLNISAADVIKAMGRRTPDDTVAQRRFRFAFIVLVPRGAQDSEIADSVKRVDRYREQLAASYARYSSNLASVDTTLNRGMRLSVFPASGVVAGASTTATLTLPTPPTSDLAVRLETPKGFLRAPAQVTVPAGATSASFTLTGAGAGVEELLAAPADATYETAYARVQVAAPAQLALSVIPGSTPNSVVAHLTDINGLAYAGARIAAAGSGSVTPAVAVTDTSGDARFQWLPGTGNISSLKLTVDAAPSVATTLNAGTGVPVIGAVVNAASFAAGVSPGSIATLFGTHLAGVTLTLNGDAVTPFYAGDTQINFYVPAETPVADSVIAVTAAAGVTVNYIVPLVAAQPGIFADAVVLSGTLSRVSSTPVQAGDVIEIYCTGLGPTRTSRGLQLATVTPIVYFGSVAVAPSFAGLAPGFVGLYQINVRVPEGLPAGTLPLLITSGNTYSNEVRIAVK